MVHSGLTLPPEATEADEARACYLLSDRERERAGLSAERIGL